MKSLMFAAVLLFQLLPVSPLSAQGDSQHFPVPFITVLGHGKAVAKPDMARIQVGVVTQATAASNALKQNNDAMTKLFATLEGRGIARKDIQTSNFSVVPQYRRGQHGEQQPEIVGYQVHNEVHLRVRKLDMLGPVLDELVEQGANQVQGISFTVAEPNRLLDEARQEAMADARRKAELYAAAASVPLGRVLAIQEEMPHQPRPMAIGMMARGAASVPIAEGEQEFGSGITVTYALGAAASPGK